MAVIMQRQVSLQRAPVNPIDKSTIISIYPRSIDETKPTLQPGKFRLEAGSLVKPSILVVGSSSWWKEVSDDQPLLEIPVYSVIVAESVVRDYCAGMLMVDMDTASPGLFWVPGEFNDPKELREKFPEQFRSAVRKQRTWYESLVNEADKLWARTQGNPLAVDEIMKMAAVELGHKDKEWLKNRTHSELIPCKACGQFNKPHIIVCPNCKVVLNAEKFKELGLTFAQ